MTRQQLDTHADERVDRLIERLLEDRGEDIAAMVLPADAIAKRIVEGAQPARGLRTGFAFVAVLLVLLVALAAAAIVGSPPPPAVPVTFECDARPLEFSGELLDPITVRDETGTVTGCREVGSVEVGSIRDTFGPPMSDFLDDTSLEITTASADDTRLLVLWILRNCDRSAQIVFTGQAPNRLDLVVNQDLDAGACAGGAAMRGVEIGFDQPLTPASVSGLLNRGTSSP